MRCPLINPADIKDVQVLKDGVATAIYGSRGANGVIVIFVYESNGQYPTVNTSTAALYDSWSPSNPNASMPKQVFNGNRSSNANSTRYLYKGDNIRLRNVELGYTFWIMDHIPCYLLQN